MSAAPFPFSAVKSSPVRDDKGEIYAAVEVFRDVTKEKKLEKRVAESANKEEGDDDKQLDFVEDLTEGEERCVDHGGIGRAHV